MKYLLAILPIFIMLTLAPALMAAPSNVYAQNKASQIIAQNQVAKQLGICISGDFTLISCNNLSDQDQTNFGNNAAAQNGGSGKGSGNTAFQGILQNQESRQNALCVSGEGTFISCNNVNDQDQTNEGNNVLLQNGGDYGWKGYKGSFGNAATQVIGQNQDSEQNSGVVSGDDTFLSGNNVNDQEQTNEGNNALAQNSGSGKDYGWKGYKGSYGNTATQVISQDQDSKQNSFVVSGEDTILSGNNINDQDQTNFGNNVAAQNSGSGSGSDNGGNEATQVISQDQDSEQNSACVSGGDTAGSCNNFNSQSQTNYGNNALLQNR